ncbi:Similar to hypothetical protein [Tuber melanosporum Mel28]; acc. no. XP_002835809 [Pyronema omphalodes CBS 100304]|uniref:Uncharacterized protein n=1 Tax=Pyronema omphalodes (strain CBS 100304) TaxID=1076935 RepID=U4L6Z1_PYROM|nr:Similar to hypothetical protein [Tuber melanosporum Mel28]; acc. no. XP_002835809 [Pyronema omphalodes CBS 100304]
MSDELSYAAVAASGPTHRANPVDEVIVTDQSVESLIDVTTGVAVVPNDFKEQEIQTETQAARVDAEVEAAETQAAAAAEAAAAAARETKAEKAVAEKKKRSCASYRSNPIVQAQGVLFAAITVALGVGAYRKYKVGALDCKTVGIWGAAAVALAGADCLASQWLFKKFGWGKYAKSE